MGSQKYYLPWNWDNLIWGSNDYVWSEVFILIQVAEALGSGGGGLALPRDTPWDYIKKELEKKKVPEETEKVFLQLVTRVNGLTNRQSKEKTDIRKEITVDHIKKTFDAFGQKIEITVKNIKKT